MPVQSGQVLSPEFTTRNPTTGAAQNADGLPTAKLLIDGATNAAAVTIGANGGAGLYTASVTVPAISPTNLVQIRVTATVAGVTDNAEIFGDVGGGGRNITNLGQSIVNSDSAAA